MSLIHAKIKFNCKLMFSSKLMQLKQILSTDLFYFKIERKRIASVTSLQSQNKNISTKKKKVLNSILESEVRPFLDENQIHLLTPLFKSSRHFKISYKFVVNYDVAKDIVDKILPHISKSEDIIVEANPGLGFITMCLINSNVPHITILDRSEMTSIVINQLVQYHKEKFKLIKVNLFKCPGLQITDLIEDSVKSNSSTKVIGVITNNTFLINLMYTYIVNELWDNIHHLEFYLVVSSTVFNNIITWTLYDSRYIYHCLFNFMFKSEVLGKYQSDAFFPIASNDKCDMTLVRIRANLDLIKSINKDELQNYFFFLDILSRKKNTFVIPTLEKFVPGCGPYLISKGVSISNIIRDFSPSEKVILFKFFKNCEGYEIFKAFNFLRHENMPSGCYLRCPQVIELSSHKQGLENGLS